MAKKHKIKKEKKWEPNANSRWLIALVIVILFVVFNIPGTRSLIIKAWHKLIPTPTPAPVKNINVSPATGLTVDQTVYVKQATEALAAKLKIKKDDIKVVSVKEKEWNDASLGCPEKGKLYTQSITSGYLIELSVGAETYIYHGGLNRVVSCGSY